MDHSQYYYNYPYQLAHTSYEPSINDTQLQEASGNGILSAPQLPRRPTLTNQPATKPMPQYNHVENLVQSNNEFTTEDTSDIRTILVHYRLPNGKDRGDLKSLFNQLPGFEYANFLECKAFLLFSSHAGAMDSKERLSALAFSPMWGKKNHQLHQTSRQDDVPLSRTLHITNLPNWHKAEFVNMFQRYMGFERVVDVKTLIKGEGLHCWVEFRSVDEAASALKDLNGSTSLKARFHHSNQQKAKGTGSGSGHAHSGDENSDARKSADFDTKDETDLSEPDYQSLQDHLKTFRQQERQYVEEVSFLRRKLRIEQDKNNLLASQLVETIQKVSEHAEIKMRLQIEEKRVALLENELDDALRKLSRLDTV
jgi:hypothetical protein